MKTPARILVVEDEAATRALIAGYLTEAGYQVVEVASAAACRSEAKRLRPDLVLLDRRLPDGDGLDLARELRAGSDVGIIFVTAVGGEIDSVLGLELGADDYITKPIALRELLARVRSTLRRVEAAHSAAPRAKRQFRLGPWTLDAERRVVTQDDGTDADLTRAEFDLLAALLDADGRPLSRAYLVELISERADEVTERTIDTLVSRLRRKLGERDDSPALIQTARGIGYKAGS